MTPDSPTDAVQDLRIGVVEATIKENTVRLGAVERSVVEIHGEIKGQNSTLADIKAGTSALGGDFRDEMRALREGQAVERREEREAAVAEAKATRESASAWWTNVFKLATAALSTAALIAGGGYVASGTMKAPAPAPTVEIAP